MKLPVCLCLFCIMIVCPVAGAAVVIDHASIAGVDSLPQATMNQIGSDLSFFFAHASVGANIVAGLNQLHTTSPSYYTLTTVYEDAVPPTTTTAGRVYEYNRGNPSWQAKVDGFKTDMDNGWGAKVSVVLNKFCYIDPAVALDYYAISNANGSAMSQLEAAYPGTKFVYMTVPYTTAADSTNAQRNTFNAALRAWVRANNKVLLDVADIEAYDANGTAATFVLGGTTYQRLFDGFSSDGGHLNDAGSQQVAKAFYALGAQLVQTPLLPGDANRDGLVDQADYTVWYNNYGASGEWGEGDFTNDGLIDQADYTIWYNNYGSTGGSVPEPMTMALLALGGLPMLRRR